MYPCPDCMVDCRCSALPTSRRPNFYYHRRLEVSNINCYNIQLFLSDTPIAPFSYGIAGQLPTA